MSAASTSDELLDLAYREALAARSAGCVPVGSLVVDPSGRVAGRGQNRVRMGKDPTAHAEIDAIRATPALWGSSERSWTIVTSAEPCLMCLGAILLLPVATIIWATRSGLQSAEALVGRDGPLGARLKEIKLIPEPSIRHRDESRALLRDFYREHGEDWRAASWDKSADGGSG